MVKARTNQILFAYANVICFGNIIEVLLTFTAGYIVAIAK